MACLNCLIHRRRNKLTCMRPICVTLSLAALFCLLVTRACASVGDGVFLLDLVGYGRGLLLLDLVKVRYTGGVGEAWVGLLGHVGGVGVVFFGHIVGGDVGFYEAAGSGDM